LPRPDNIENAAVVFKFLRIELLDVIAVEVFQL